MRPSATCYSGGLAGGVSGNYGGYGQQDRLEVMSQPSPSLWISSVYRSQVRFLVPLLTHPLVRCTRNI